MGLAESTHKLYACGVRRFMGICSTAGQTPVPADKDTLCHFAATLAVEGLRHRTIKSYMAGVRHLSTSQRVMGIHFQLACIGYTTSCGV